jgi:hypothetical protein
VSVLTPNELEGATTLLYSGNLGVTDSGAFKGDIAAKLLAQNESENLRLIFGHVQLQLRF